MNQEKMYHAAGNNNSVVISLLAASRKTFCYPVRMFPYVMSARDTRCQRGSFAKKGMTSVHGKVLEQAAEQFTF